MTIQSTSYQRCGARERKEEEEENAQTILYEIMGRIPGIIGAELARNVGITPVQLAE